MVSLLRKEARAVIPARKISILCQEGLMRALDSDLMK